MQITGTLKAIKETQQITEKFQKREFVVATNEQYPQFISLELQGDKCDIIDAYGIGEEVVCDLNLRGRLWINPQGEEKYFNTIVCWKIQRIENSTNSPSQERPQANQSNSFVDSPTPNFNEEEHDDLPF